MFKYGRTVYFYTFGTELDTSQLWSNYSNFASECDNKVYKL